MNDTQICPSCNKEKHIAQFLKNKNGIENRSWCAWCRHGNKYVNKYHNTIKGRRTIKKANNKALIKPMSDLVRYNTAVALAKGKQNRKGIVFSLTIEEYSKLISAPCYYCNNLICVKRAAKIERGMGIDRINNDLGYELGNVLPCGGFCNYIRGNRLTVNETKEVILLIIKLRNLN